MQTAKGETKSPALPSQKKSDGLIFGVFGCCKPVQYEKDPRMKRTMMAHPASTIELDNPPAKSAISSYLDTYLGNRFTFGAPHCTSRALSLLIKEENPLDQVFILGQKHKIVSKITQKKVDPPTASQFLSFAGGTDMASSTNLRASVGSSKSVKKEPQKDSLLTSLRKTFFSKQKESQKEEECPGMIPENIARHIANRLKTDILIDALCGHGGTAIQFAKHCDFVLAIDSLSSRTQAAKNHAMVNDVANKIDFLTVDFLKIKNLHGDIVFLDPSDIRKDPAKEIYSVFNHAEPDLPSLISKALGMSYQIALKLPHDIDITELPELFHTTLEKYGLFSKRFCIEIEMVSSSEGKPECTMIYFGDCSSIEPREEYEAIYDFLFMEEEQNVKTKTSVQVVSTIIEKIGIKKSFKYLSELDDPVLGLNDNPKNSRYENFLDKIIKAGLLTKDQINQFIAEGGRDLKAASTGYGLDSNPSTALKRNSSSPFQTVIGNNLIKSPAEEALKRFSGGSGGLKGLATHNRVRSNIEGDLTPGLRHREMKFGYNEILEDGNTPPPSSSMSKFDMDGYNFEKSSHDVSELDVSSYSSVSSGYLKDYSWNEDGSSLNQKKMTASKIKKRDSTISRNRTSSFNFRYDSPRETVESTENKSSKKKVSRFVNDLSMNSNKSDDGNINKSFSESLNRSFNKLEKSNEMNKKT